MCVVHVDRPRTRTLTNRLPLPQVNGQVMKYDYQAASHHEKLSNYKWQVRHSSHTLERTRAQSSPSPPQSAPSLPPSLPSSFIPSSLIPSSLTPSSHAPPPPHLLSLSPPPILSLSVRSYGRRIHRGHDHVPDRRRAGAEPQRAPFHDSDDQEPRRVCPLRGGGLWSRRRLLCHVRRRRHRWAQKATARRLAGLP